MVWPSQSTESADPGSEKTKRERESMLPQTLDSVSPTATSHSSVHKARRWGFWGSLKDGVWEKTEHCLSVPRQGQATQGSACEFYCYQNHFLWWRSSCVPRTARLKPLADARFWDHMASGAALTDCTANEQQIMYFLHPLYRRVAESTTQP